MSDEKRNPRGLPGCIPQDVDGATRFLLRDPEKPAVYHDGSRVLAVVMSRIFWKQMPEHEAKVDDRKEMMEGWLACCNRDMRKLGLAEIGWDEATADIEVPPPATQREGA